MKEERSDLRPKTRQEIAKELNICSKTLRRRLLAAGIDLPGGLVLPADQKRIYEALYYPPPPQAGMVCSILIGRSIQRSN